MRIDLALVHLGLVRSRSKAQQLLKQDKVKLFNPQKNRFEKIQATHQKVNLEELQEHLNWIQLEDDEIEKYVSRGGLKLERALRELNLDVQDLKILDVGQSTGGFTDCLLQYGALKVIGVDVGQGQLDPKIKDHSKVQSYEGINARTLSQEKQFQIYRSSFDFIVMDISFISITYVIPELLSFLKPEGKILSLVKPQFELSKNQLNKKGIVTDSQNYETVENKIKSHCLENKLEVLNYISSKLEGKLGNKEFFVYAQKTSVF